MRHALKAARRVVVAVPLAATLAASPVGVAHAIDSPGGAPAPVAAVATRGTGGTEYVVVAPRVRTARKPTRRSTPKPAHPPRRPLATPRPTPAPPASSESTAGVPSPTQSAAEGAVFPVGGPHSFGGPENRFGAPRAGHTHQGQDILAA
jgi:hypothetical protein